MVPEGMLGRKRLTLEHVEHGSAELTLVQRGEQVVLIQVSAARDVDDACAARQQAEAGGAQDAS